MKTPIDLKNVIARIPYKIEPNPQGGFIARAADPSVPSIEAPTREELTQKIIAVVRSEFPELHIPFRGKNAQVSVQLKSGNEEVFLSTDPNEVAGSEYPIDMKNEALEKLLGFASKHLTPELAKQLAEQAGTTSFQLTVNNKTAVRINSGPQGLTFGAPKAPAIQSAATDIPKLDAVGIMNGQPITPEPSNFRRTLKLIVWAMILGTFAYLYFVSRH